MKKPEPEVVPYLENYECDKCGRLGAFEFVTENLCPQCIADEVFSDFSPDDE